MSTPEPPQPQRCAVWAGVLLGCAGASVIMAATVSIQFLAFAGLSLTGAYAAWLGLSFLDYLESIDDTALPPVGPD